MTKKRAIRPFIIVSIAAIFWTSSSPSSHRVDLSPRNWPQGELQKYTIFNQQHGQSKPLAESSRAVVSGTSEALAVRAGLEALKQGGSAADAALTTSLAQIALAAGSYVSYAGAMTVVYFEAATGKTYAMNARFNTLLEENDPLSIPVSGIPSGRTALVPGFMAGAQALHDRFGRLPWAALFDPAIYFAEEGFEIDSTLAAYITQRQTVLTRLPETRKIFTKPNGAFYQRGDIFVQPQLAATLKKTAGQSADYMYRGEWAAKFVDAVRQEGGKMILKDLLDYRTDWREAERGTYEAYDVATLSPPNLGGVRVIEALNFLELANASHFQWPSSKSRYPLFHYKYFPFTFYWLVQIADFAYLYPENTPLTASRYFPSADFSPASRVKKANASSIWAVMQDPNWPRLYQDYHDQTSSAAPDIERRDDHSAAVVVVDEFGNMAAVEHTINTATWGTTGIFVDGVSIPDSACFQQYTIKTVGPGVRLPDPSNPLLILKDGMPVLASSSIGSGLHTVTIQNLFNTLRFGLDPKTAVETVNFLMPDWSPPGLYVPAVKKFEFSDKVLAVVRSLGQGIAVLSASEASEFSGYWVGLVFNPETGKWQAGAPRTLNGFALGY